ncbi:MAG: DUF4097 family beta strand repeat-containing protein [Bacillota bacterium]
MFSRINIKKLVLWLVIIFVCSVSLGTAVLFAKGDIPFVNTSENTREIDEEKVFPVEGIKNINVSTVSSDIKIIPVESGEIKVHYYGSVSGKGDVPELVTEVSGDGLDVRIKHYKRPVKMFSFYMYKLNIDIYVPKGYSNSLKLTTVSGKITTGDINLHNLALSSVSGDLNISGAATKNIVASTTSGNANLNSVSGNAKLSSVSGNITAEFLRLESDISISTVSGNSRISLPENADFEVNFNTTSGNFNSNFPLEIGDHSKRNVSGKTGSGKNTIQVKSVSGDLEIKK